MAMETKYRQYKNVPQDAKLKDDEGARKAVLDWARRRQVSTELAKQAVLRDVTVGQAKAILAAQAGQLAGHAAEVLDGKA